MGKPIVAVVGRPNVGKSTLFNKLIGQRLAIVEDTPGVTRDRIFGECEWQNHEFLLVDTGGIDPNEADGILAHIRQQAQVAIDAADCIVMVTDINAGVTAQDRDVAALLMRSGKPVVLAVNKCDKVGEPPMELYDFYSLGLGEVFPVSSVHGHGTGDLLDAVCAHLPDADEGAEEDERITVAVIGRPNVGKSSLVNFILAPPATPSTAMWTTSTAASSSPTLPACASGARWKRAWSATACCAAWRRWSAAGCASS